MPRHVGEENSEYSASADYPYLMQKKIPNIASALSVYTESIISITRSCFEKKFPTHWQKSFTNGFIQIFTKKFYFVTIMHKSH